MRSLLEIGWIVRWKAGNQTQYQVPMLDNLAEVYSRAEEFVDPDKERSGGRRVTADGDRRVEALTESQYEDKIGPAVRKIGKHVHASSDAEQGMLAIDRSMMVWDPQAGPGGNGDWREILQLVRDATDDLKSKTTEQYVSAVRTLLDLAATYAWIPRAPRHDADYEAVPADWSSTYNRWREQLKGHVPRLRVGLMGLFEGCNRVSVGPTTAKGQDWSNVIEHLEEHFATNSTPPRNRYAVRAAYRELRSKGLIDGPDWNGRQRQREAGLCLVSTKALDRVAKLYGRDTRQAGVKAALAGDTVEWPGWKEYEEGLLSGPFGLRRTLLYFTAAPDVRDDLGLRPRGVFPRQQVRNLKPYRMQPWRAGTIKSKMRAVCLALGFLSERRGVSWETDDLRELANRESLKAYRRFLRDESEANPRTQARYLKYVAVVLSPWLETVALQEDERDLANRCQELSAMIAAAGGVEGTLSWVAQLRRRDNRSYADRMRAKAKAIERTWAGKSRQYAEHAYIQHRRVARNSLALFEGRYGPLEEQVEARRTNCFSVDGYANMDRRWATRTRDLVYWFDQLHVPLRSATSTAMAVNDREIEGGTVSASLAGNKRKSGSAEAFEPSYRGSYPHLLFELYTLREGAGGAREVLLTPDGLDSWSAAPGDEEPFYVHDLARAETPWMDGDALRRIVRRTVKDLLNERPNSLNGLRYQDLQDGADGVLGTHMFRHSFARLLVLENPNERGKEVAAQLLDHVDTTMVEKVYAWRDETDYDQSSILDQAVEQHEQRKS